VLNDLTAKRNDLTGCLLYSMGYIIHESALWPALLYISDSENWLELGMPLLFNLLNV